MDMQQFTRNRLRFPPEELERHAGKYTAFSPDGTKIIASDNDPLKVAEMVRLSGYDPSECVLSSVPLPDEVVLGGRLDE